MVVAQRIVNRTINQFISRLPERELSERIIQIVKTVYRVVMLCLLFRIVIYVETVQ